MQPLPKPMGSKGPQKDLTFQRHDQIALGRLILGFVEGSKERS